eukprot:snap_masked-scaffold_21-processed-gene-5.75-mRNA-1 protein AED:1.00 eAED:1.00 QI:0/-1/0/0/-1/1/1/0/227
MKTESETVVQETRNTASESGVSPMETFIGKLTRNFQLYELQEDEDCEYEYESIFDCVAPYSDAVIEVYNSLTPEGQEAFTELVENDEVDDLAAFGEALAEIVGEGRFCVEEYVTLLPLRYTCFLPTCINCEVDGELYRNISAEAEEDMNLIFGCGIEFALCEEEIPTQLPTSSPVDRDNLENASFYLSIAALGVSLMVLLLVLFRYNNTGGRKEKKKEMEIVSTEML